VNDGGLPHPTGTCDGQPPWAFGFALVLGVLVLFLVPALRAGFGYDDRAVIHENPLVTGSVSGWEAWSRDFWHSAGDAGLYRPLVTLSLRAQADSPDPHPRPFHLVNLALHAYVVLLALCVWFPRGSLGWGGVVGLLLFAWHPVQTEVALWIPGRSSSLAAWLGLLGMWAWLRSGSRWRPAWAFLGVLGPLLVKEDGLAFAAWFAVMGSKRDRGALLLALGTYLGMRWHALGPHGWGAIHAPLMGLSLWERLQVGGRVLVWGCAEWVWPWRHPLAPDRAQLAAMAPWRWIVAGTLALGVWVSARRGRGHGSRPWTQNQRAALAAGATACLPWLQLLPAPELFAPRFLYLPMLWAIPLLDRWFPKPVRPRPWALLAVGSVCWMGVQGLVPAYHDALGYWEYRRRVEPGRGEVWNGLGNEWLRTGSDLKAQAAFEQAIQVDPGYSRSYVGLALCAERSGQLAKAAEWLDQALLRQPDNPVALANRARLWMQELAWGPALALYQRAAALQPGRAVFWRGVARCSFELGDKELGRKALETALELDPGDARAHRLLERWLR